MIYHHIALNTLLPLLTYAHSEALPFGSRVVVTLNNKKQVGVVWAADVVPDFDVNKILPIQEVLADDFRLPENWRALIEFAARYYHYPLGQTVFTALPAALKESKALSLPQSPLFYTLNELGKTQTPPPKNHVKKLALWQALFSGSHSLGSLKAIASNAAKMIQEYESKQWLEISEQAAPIIPPSSHQLNATQNESAQQVKSKLGQYQPFLLYGITGSGKTEVYFDIMAQVLAEGKQVLFLLPEINLTPQLLARIATRFPDMPTAVLHSQTAAGARGQDYLRALSCQAKLVIGTRLAVFTPLADLGLIVVDEEHDTSFKQDNDLRYHARDLAVWRAHQSGCPIVLGSATPSLETWHKAQTGAYQLLTLPERAHQASRLPEIQMLDVSKLTLDNGISPQALKLLQQNHQAGGLSLVYLNRRGFAPALFCGDCGHTFGCPNCAAKMVLHQRARQLRCHHCDFRQPTPSACPECGNQDLTAIGQGTQRIEDTLRLALPQANIARVDRDTTSRKNDWDDLYQQIQAGAIDVLVGTQMLAKGHDFARLNLVIVLNADGSLFSSDFRAPERLFAELMQVSGRAGRAEKQGRVLIQSRLPEHYVFQAIRAQHYPLFANHELAQRELFDMPPFGFQAAIRADAPKMAQAIEFLNNIRDVIAPMLPEKVFQMGAVPMLMARLAQRERAQIFIESPSRKQLHHALSLWQQVLQQNRDGQIRWHIDVDVQDM
ncbi:primosomal protein N' [Neisseriaceae bacterium B1]